MALAGYRKVVSDPKFKTSKFEYDLKKLGQAVEAIRQELLKHAKP